MNILCIDDDPVYLLVLKTTLARFNSEDTLFFADNGEKGLEIFSNHKIDLLITDLNLPGISGLELLKQSKKLYSCIEVFLISGLATLNEAIDAIKSGARDFLLKPLNPAMITEKIGMVRDLLDRRKEADDYRLAKETIENQAHDSICQLEMISETFHSTMISIKTILDSTTINDSEKCSQIQSIIAKVTHASIK
jgi:DNA-binding NtrC family response regulator